MTTDTPGARARKPAPDGPKARYERDLAKPDFVRDPAQAHAVDALQALYDEIVARDAGPDRSRGWLDTLLRRDDAPEPVTGLYLWGGVGRGKTYLMDCFFDVLPLTEKRRTHFYRFMRDVHAARKRYRNETDPLDKIGAEWAESTRILCFDEFFVSDIADAMILGGLLEALFARGVTLVATSNVAPNDLYRDGLQRSRFLPTIDLLKRHVRTLHVDGGEDFRLRLLERSPVYYTPLDDAAKAGLARTFEHLAPEPGESDTSLTVQGRDIPVRRLSDGIAWFDFEALVGGRRSAADYVELARCYQAVLLSDVPVFDRYHENDARRFISLVDEFYDRRVKLILSAAAPPDALYQGKRLHFEFERTHSRLLEMQSIDYLGHAHLA